MSTRCTGCESSGVTVTLAARRPSVLSSSVILRRLRHFECSALQVLLKPQILGDGVFVGMMVIQVRRNTEAHAVIGQVAPVPSHVVDMGVKIVRGREPQDRTRHERDVGVVGNARQLQRRALGSSRRRAPAPSTLREIARRLRRMALRRCIRLSIPASFVVSLPPMEWPCAPIRAASTSGCCSRKVIARRAAISTTNQLLFLGDSTASSVYSSGVSPGKMVRLVALRRMRRIELAPVRLRAAHTSPSSRRS